MSSNESNNEFDNIFRKGLENLTEEKASAAEWQKMKVRMEKERLLASKNKGARFLTLLLITLFVVGTGAFFFYNKTTSRIGDGVNKKEKFKKEASAGKQKMPLQGPVTTQEVSKNKETQATTFADLSETKEDNAIKTSDTEASEQTKSVKANPGIINRKRSGKEKPSPAFADTSQAKSALPPAAIAYINNEPTTKDGNTEVSHDTIPNSFTEQEAADTAQNPAVGISSEEKSDSSKGINIQKNLLNHNDTGKIAADTTILLNKLQSADSSKADSTKANIAIKKTTERKRIYIGGYFSLDFNSYLVKKNNTVPADEVNYVYNSGAINGNSGTQFTAGVTGEYLLSNHIAIEADASYSKKKTISAILYTPAVNDSFSTAYSQYIYNYNATYLEFSGKIKYYFPLGNNKWIYAGVGGIAGFNFPGNNLGYYIHTSYLDSVWVKSDKVTLQPASALFTAIGVAGFETALNDKWNAFIESEYKYGFSPVIEQAAFNYIPVNHYWRTFSIAIGLKHGF